MSPRGLISSLLLLCCCCGSCKGGEPKPPATPADHGTTEGLAFPDRLTPAGDGASLDRSFPSDARADERPDRWLDLARDQPLPPDQRPPDTRPPDTRPPDTWPGGPCLYDWSGWTCQPILSSYCAATCGGGAAQIVCLSSCTCKKASGSKACPTTGTGCTRCLYAFKSGCCTF